MNPKAFGLGSTLVVIAGLAAMVAAEASPARLVTSTNLRQAPGLESGIIATIPANSAVEVLSCKGQWCNVQWGPRGGYVVAKTLDRTALVPMEPGGPGYAGPPVAVDPGPVVVGPPAVYVSPGYYGGPRWGYGYRRW